jgi:uncharacterized protein YigE (DUF2233 family)
MNKISLSALVSFIVLSIISILIWGKPKKSDDDRFVTYIADTKLQHLQLYWKDDKHINFSSIENLKNWVEKNNEKLVFAANAGMYKPDKTPQGLFIENKKLLSPLDTLHGNGNFYLKPNGIFYINTENQAAICTTLNFLDTGNIKYATQSGPMLVIDGQIHPAFIVGSTNVNIRNGVGILPDGKVFFAMSKAAINFYYFAMYFKSMGCKNALYLDGLVSRTYLPEQKWVQTDGDFGVMIGVTTP